MKKKLLILLCLVALMAFTFASCDLIGNGGSGNDVDNTTPEDEECIHTFSENWSSNSTQHWHAATCEHNDQKSELADHTDVDQDSSCDTCGYKVNHTHTYSEEWTTDEVAHWRTATCLHTDVKGDYAEHVDTNANGKCDVCDADVIIEIDTDNYAEIINTILASRGGVASGTVIFDSEFTSLGEDGFAKSSSVFDYVFGANCVYYKSQNYAYNKDKNGKEESATSVWEKWQESLGAENVFGVYKEGDEPIAMDGAATPDTLNGYYFAVSTLANEYGVENILYTLYTLANDSSASDLVWTIDETTGVYTFDFNYLWINRDVAEGEDPNVNYYELTVSFAFNDNYVLTTLDIICDCYTNSLENEADNDYTYDDATGTITMKPEGQYAADTYTFKVTQVAGERTYVNENPRSKFLPETFELFSDSALSSVVTDSITVVVNKVSTLYLGNFLPEGTSITFDPAAFNVSITYGGETYHSNSGSGFMNEVMYLAHTALGTAPSVIFNLHELGEYTLTVSIGTDDVKSVTINAVESGSGSDSGNVPSEALTTIEVTVSDMYVKGDESDWAVVAGTPDYIVSFTATESGMYTVNIPKGLAAYDKYAYDNTFGTASAIGPWVELSEWNPVAGSFDVYLEAGETYEFYVATYELGTTTFTITYYRNEQ